MKSIGVLSLVLLASPTAAPAPAAAAPVAGFSVTIEHAPRSWRLTCTAGCSWQVVTYTCQAGACSVRVDADGIAAAPREPTPGTPFAFVLRDTRTGWAASSLGGTAWVTLGWGCEAPARCTARVDESGVAPSPAPS